MKTRIWSVLLALIMVLAMLTACNTPEKGEKGDKGDQGEPGEKGETGATIEKIEYDDQGRLVITLTDGTVLEPVTIPSVETTGGLAYYPLPDGTYGVAAGTTYYLETVEIPSSFNGKAVTKILPNAFNGAHNLKMTILPNSIVEIGYAAFWDCDSLKNITIPNSVTSIGASAFGACSSLEEITIPNGITSIEHQTFAFCTNLKEVVVPEGVTNITSEAFTGCTNLETVTMPNSVMKIGTEAFAFCANLEQFTIPDSIISIGREAFKGCEKLFQKENGVYYVDKWVIDCDPDLSSAVIRENIVGIAGEGFKSGAKLTSVIIPKSIRYIDEYSFDCVKLTTLYYCGNEEEWGEIEIGEFNWIESLTICYYSAERPIGSGDFWHYNYSGIPAKW